MTGLEFQPLSFTPSEFRSSQHNILAVGVSQCGGQGTADLWQMMGTWEINLSEQCQGQLDREAFLAWSCPGDGIGFLATG